MTDIKELLDGAFTDEPPLGITREAVISKGRGRLVRRRTAIGATLSVTVAATLLGASLLSGSPPEPVATGPCHLRPTQVAQTLDEPSGESPQVPTAPPTTTAHPPYSPPR